MSVSLLVSLSLYLSSPLSLSVSLSVFLSLSLSLSLIHYDKGSVSLIPEFLTGSEPEKYKTHSLITQREAAFPRVIDEWVKGRTNAS